jgi:alkyl sulfatase BDS1-like metallo-beta-lactamase superfamily hydrolase
MSASSNDAGTALQTLLRRPSVQGNFDHYYADVAIAYDAGKNLAFTQDAPTVHPNLTAHSRRMGQRIYRVADTVYSAVGYALANVIFVVGDGGIVVVDCAESLEGGAACYADFKLACPAAAALPVVAVIYSHNHTDHIGGVRAFTTNEAVASGACQIIAHRTLMAAVANNASVVAPILGARSAYSFGALLEVGALGQVNGGIGPVLARGKTTFITPTLTFDAALDITLAGIRFELRHAPSETDDEIVAWLPELGVLLSAEVIQGECLANVHTIRGTRYRDPQQWVATIDVLRQEHTLRTVRFMVPAHGRPVAGAENIAELLTAYRDAIAFIHDQAARFMNHGYTPDELAQVLPALPPHLAAHAWLGEYYGTVTHSVRQVYSGQLGWFDGDPATLDPLPLRESAAKWLALIGGRDAALAAAQTALNGNPASPATPAQPRWAAEIATMLIRVDASDTAAKLCKAQAFEALGYATDNINWRNWYLTAARELRGAYDDFIVGQGGGGALASPDILGSLTPAHLLGLLAVRVAAERCMDAHHWLQFDVGLANGEVQPVTLELRRGVLQIHSAIVANMPATAPVLTLSKSSLMALLKGGAAVMPELLMQGEVKVTQGTLASVAALFGCFEPRATSLPKLASR